MQGSNMEITERAVLLSSKHMQDIGFPRAITYQLLNRADLPVVIIGGRKFMHRDLFLKWLEEQATAKKGA